MQAINKLHFFFLDIYNLQLSDSYYAKVHLKYLPLKYDLGGTLRYGIFL